MALTMHRYYTRRAPDVSRLTLPDRVSVAVSSLFLKQQRR
jgi:hypothetical protein